MLEQLFERQTTEDHLELCHLVCAHRKTIAHTVHMTTE